MGLDHFLKAAPWGFAIASFTVLNLAIFAGAVLVGRALSKVGTLRVTPPAPPITRHETLLAACTVILNVAITTLGLLLYRQGYVQVTNDISWRTPIEIIALLLVMDLVMYVLHRLAHHRWFFWMHAQHHKYEHARPLTLFVLHPVETVSFGSLWLVVLLAASAFDLSFSWLGIGIYLTLNVAFGTLGHLGNEPLGRHAHGWLRIFGTSGFHGTHHMKKHVNFGFYTSIWDQLFGTWELPKLGSTAIPWQ